MVKRKRTKGQTTQWSKEKGQKDRQHNGQKKKDKRTDNTMVKRKRTKGQTTQWSKEKGQRSNNDHQNTTQKTKDRSTRTPLLWLLGNSFVIDTLLHTISPKYDSVDSLLIIWKQTKLSAGDNFFFLLFISLLI